VAQPTQPGTLFRGTQLFGMFALMMEAVTGMVAVPAVKTPPPLAARFKVTKV